MADATAEMNIETTEQLNALAKICCDKMNGDTDDISGRVEALLKSILMGGYVGKFGQDIRAQIETRAKDRCRDVAMHRHGELAGLTLNFQKKFNKLVTWQSTQVEPFTPSKAVNLGSATGA